MYIILIILALILFYLQREMIGILKKERLKFNYYDAGFTNTTNLFALIKKEKNQTKQLNYSILIGMFVIIMFFFILAVLSLIF